MESVETSVRLWLLVEEDVIVVVVIVAVGAAVYWHPSVFSFMSESISYEHKNATCHHMLHFCADPWAVMLDEIFWMADPRWDVLPVAYWLSCCRHLHRASVVSWLEDSACSDTRLIFWSVYRDALQ